jgi:hypothetical protein
MGYTLDGKPDDGLLPTDRTHFVKVTGTYQFDWWGSKSNTTDLNLFYQIGSGTPVTTRARYGVVSGMIVSGRGDLGRTEYYTQTDGSLTHKYKFGKDNRFALAFDLNVLNLFNQAGELSRRETIARSEFPASQVGCSTVPVGDTPVRCLTRAIFNGAVTSTSYLAYINAGSGGDPTARTDRRYNLPQLYQAPREVRLGFRFIF